MIADLLYPRRYERTGGWASPAAAARIMGQPLDWCAERGGDPRALGRIGADLGIIVGLLLAMTARPDLVEPGQALRTVRSRDRIVTWWSPTVVGARYRVARREDAAAGAPKRLHWVRGHYRAQPHGPGRRLRRIVWIEPHLAGRG